MHSSLRAQAANVLAALRAGRASEAVASTTAMLRAWPDDETVLGLHAAALEACGRPDQAREVLRRLTREHPRTWQHWNSLGNVERKLQHADAALQAYARALELEPAAAGVHFNMGSVLLAAADYARACIHLDIAVHAPDAPASASVWAAVAAYAAGDEDLARTMLMQVADLARLPEEARLELGWLQVQMQEVDAGLCTLATVQTDPALARRAAARCVLALERINRLQEAETALAALVESDPVADTDARLELHAAKAAIAMRYGNAEGARRSYEAALALGPMPHAGVPLWFGLARACDRLGDPEAALVALGHAHAAVAQGDSAAGATPATRWAAGLLQARAQQPWPAGWRERSGAGIGPAEPVFVVGFPRSGTTLVEHMLVADETCVSMGERPFVLATVARLEADGGRYPDALAALDEAALARLREHYWSGVQRAGGTRGRRLVDKNPLNMVFLPLLVRLFPDAPVIHCLRHPLDALLSCYMQDFRDPFLRWMCATPERLAQHYVNFMQHFADQSERLAPKLLDVRYERLVADPCEEIGRMADFAGLRAEAMAKRASEGVAPGLFIATPSYAQVARPVHAEAVGRWRPYRQHLHAVAEQVAPTAARLGYAL